MQVKKEDVNNAILSAALEEFSISGYKGANIRLIAERAGITPGNIYAYYKSKQELFLSVMNGPVEAIELYLKSVSKGMAPNNNTITYIASTITELFLKYKKAFLILVNQSKGTRFENFRCELSSAIAERLEADYFSLSGKKIDPMLPLVVARAFIEGIFTIFENIPDDEPRIGKMIKAYLELMFADSGLVHISKEE